ncbi:thrombospondin type 3 repeat-containing domain protein [Opisthorchis viverrini]|uniref:Thrombospondin type 3 repeat-containing domain protein n=1 Tax=Opisthorchis viverrini TaxID=6198 RepID=A0A1S8X3B2_OPIVI|nr:thrombospondin type 3 repeat-containing domain protein [Opisthorchis viverrini]
MFSILNDLIAFLLQDKENCPTCRRLLQLPSSHQLIQDHFGEDLYDDDKESEDDEEDSGLEVVGETGDYIECRILRRIKQKREDFTEPKVRLLKPKRNGAFVSQTNIYSSTTRKKGLSKVELPTGGYKEIIPIEDNSFEVEVESGESTEDHINYDLVDNQVKPVEKELKGKNDGVNSDGEKQDEGRLEKTFKEAEESFQKGGRDKTEEELDRTNRSVQDDDQQHDYDENDIIADDTEGPIKSVTIEKPEQRISEVLQKDTSGTSVVLEGHKEELAFKKKTDKRKINRNSGNSGKQKRLETPELQEEGLRRLEKFVSWTKSKQPLEQPEDSATDCHLPEMDTNSPGVLASQYFEEAVDGTRKLLAVKPTVQTKKSKATNTPAPSKKSNGKQTVAKKTKQAFAKKKTLDALKQKPVALSIKAIHSKIAEKKHQPSDDLSLHHFSSLRERTTPAPKKKHIRVVGTINDHDCDGIPDDIDEDIDNDGLLDRTQDSDWDGELNHVDLDDDNDGIPDTEDDDANGDGILDCRVDTSDHAFVVRFKTKKRSADSDMDGIPDEVDGDDDDDGIPDMLEDEDGDQIPDLFKLTLKDTTRSVSGHAQHTNQGGRWCDLKTCKETSYLHNPCIDRYHSTFEQQPIVRFTSRDPYVHLVSTAHRKWDCDWLGMNDRLGVDISKWGK